MLVIATLWFPSIPVGMFAIVLAVLGAIVSIVEFKGWTRIILTAVFTVLGIGEGIAIKEADNAHNAEVQSNAREISGIKDQLQKSELQRVADTKFLEGQLSVFAQFAPAIVKLAQATEENTRRQYETKKLSNKELRDFTTPLVARMREFEKQYRAQFQKIYLKYPNAINDPAEMQKEETELRPLYMNYENQFRANFLSDAVFCRDQLRAKLNIPPERRDGMAALAFSGMLAGPSPVADAADYLEQMARKLVP